MSPQQERPTLLIFRGLISAGNSDDIPLDRGACAVAAAHDSECDLNSVCRSLDRLAEEVLDMAGPGPGEEALLQSLKTVLFQVHGFIGNCNNYYDPTNSFLSQVLETKKGNPITLSVLMIEVGRRVGLELAGIGLPCHFMVGFRSAIGIRYFDPFSGGIERSREECCALVRLLSGGSVDVDLKHFAPVGNRTILLRMLLNLRCIYRQRREPDRLALILEQILCLGIEDPSIHGELALLLVDQGRISEAHAYLERMIENAETPLDSQRSYWVEKVRAELASFN